MTKVYCEKCDEVAVWQYEPRGTVNYCDECVPRGCSCNIDPETGKWMHDDQGRDYPCCEYDYFEDGVDAD